MASISAVGLDGARVELAGELVDDLATRLTGELLRPGDAAYDRARELWNGMIDKRPALIARCASEQDVVACVDFGRAHGLLLAVRGGGHGVAGQASCDGGLVIDLSAMKRIEVDAHGRRVRAQAGCRLGELDSETQRHGLATPLGVVTQTGIAGLTLSGGMGWLRRKHGLTCDNVISARVVTADGAVLTASEDAHEDLLWAIRGGGGNFGVVTSFDFRLHPVGPEVMFCFVLYPAARALEVLRLCERHLAEVGDELSPLGVLGRAPAVEPIPAEWHGEPFVALLGLSSGDPAQRERVLGPLRSLDGAIADLSGVMPYTQAQAALDEDYPDGGRYYWKSINVNELSDELIERLVEHAAVAPSPHSTIDIWYQGGAMARVAEHETAFANRHAPYLLGIEANWERGPGSDAHVAWVRSVFDDMHAFSGGGVYLNFPGFLEDGMELLRQGYGANLPRLVEVKTKYDPGNLFRLNANIPPRAADVP